MISLCLLFVVCVCWGCLLSNWCCFVVVLCNSVVDQFLFSVVVMLCGYLLLC